MKHFCQIILYLDKWFRRCNLKDFLSTALEILLEDIMENILTYFKLGPVI